MQKLLAVFSFMGALAAQTPSQVNIVPDCTRAFTLTAAGARSPAINNLQAGCVNWTMTYTSQGFSAISLAIESAPNVAGAPGTWVTFSGGTLVSGVNPNTSTTNAATEISDGYNPFVSMHLVSATGSGVVSGILYGCKKPGCAGGGSSGGGGITQDVNVKQVGGTNTVSGGLAGSLGVGGLAANGSPVAGNPNLMAGKDGSNNARDLSVDANGRLNVNSVNVLVPSCLNQSAFTVASGLVSLVAAVGGQTIYVCHIDLAISVQSDLKLTQGTQTTTPCDTGATDLTGLYKNTLTFTQDYSAGSPLHTLATGQQLCLSSSAAVTGGGVILYAQF